jgi:hypothetical protein
MFGCTNSVTRLLFFVEERKYTADELILSQGVILDKITILHKGEIRYNVYHG